MDCFGRPLFIAIIKKVELNYFRMEIISENAGKGD